MSEIWKPIPGYEGAYEVSDLGRVRSLSRFDTRGKRLASKIMSPGARPSGHLHVNLWRNGRPHKEFVHRLVLLAFVGPAPRGMICCHRTPNASDNRLENLRWDTPSANMRDRVRDGNDPQANRRTCPAGHAFAGDNLYIRPNGSRGCRACHRAATRAYRARRAAAKDLAIQFTN